MNEFEFDDNLYTILKGIISGFLIAYLIILGLRPSAEYPDNIIEIIDNPWIFVVLILINFYVMQWDLTIGLLLLLSIIALLLDVIIFTEGEVFNSDINIEQFEDKDVSESDSESDSESGSESGSESDSEESNDKKKTDKSKANNGNLDSKESKDKKKTDKSKPNKGKSKNEKDEKDQEYANKIIKKVLSSIKNNIDKYINE